MSLVDQQWCPTSVQVTALQARGLRIKGKSGTNDAYAVIQVGKEKYQTSVVEKSVAPVWKEEATFDLPPLHQEGGGGAGAERCTLRVHVLHRALVGPDKLLGQAVINLPQLSEDKTRAKTEWFKLLDKTGKPDKDRGEVLLDIHFMRNNMTASMFDLSAAGKSRSRLGKLKDKVRGKKKESDSASAFGVVPSFTQVMTDSEEEGNGEGVAGKDGKSKKHKMKSLFSPKSNLQRNMSQSMSVLPAKNSSLSGSQSSGLNVDSSEGQHFFFEVPVEQSNLCINGSHIYCEEPPPRSSRIGSNFSLASSGHGSMEDVPESSPPSVDSLRARVEEERIRREEEEERQEQEEKAQERKRQERKLAEERRLEEEERRLEEQRREEERRQKEAEVELMRKQEAEQKRQREEEQVMRQKEAERVRKEKEEWERLEERRIEEEKVRKEEEERMRKEEEIQRKKEEEKRARRQEEIEEKRRQEEQERSRLLSATCFCPSQVHDTEVIGPYSQLTKEELICLVLKQETQLLDREKKISELELYIDNLLVRVIEEQPSILMSLSSIKKAA
ncbi:rab11 family-interacting protein 1-like [Xenentodon cancila]